MFCEYDESEIQEIQKLKEKEIVGKYVKIKRQPSLEETSKWTKEMITEFKDKWEEMWNNVEDIEEDVLQDDTQLATSMEVSELDGKGCDILYKKDNITYQRVFNDYIKH